MEKIVQRHLKDIRSMLGWSQEKMANKFGCTRQNIAVLESHKTHMSRTQVYALLYIIEHIEKRLDVINFINVITMGAIK